MKKLIALLSLSTLALVGCSSYYESVDSTTQIGPNSQIKVSYVPVGNKEVACIVYAGGGGRGAISCDW